MMFKKSLSILFAVLFAFSVCFIAMADDPVAIPPVPTGLTLRYGQSLSDIKFDDNNFVWESDPTVARYVVGENKFYVNYDVNNDGVFEAAHMEVIVTIECKHDWGEFHSDNNAKFIEDGTLTRTCKICGATETKTDPDTSKLKGALMKVFGSSMIGDAISKVVEILMKAINWLMGFILPKLTDLI